MTTLPVLQTYEKDQTKINFTINQIARALNDNTTFIYAKAAGIVGDGVVDDTTAIQTAINALPPSGGTILFDAGMNCKVSSTLKLGDGTASTFSTKAGMRLVGMGIPPGEAVSLGFPLTSTGVQFTWAGGASDFVQVLGPLQGWGIDNILFNGNSIATIGLDVISGQFGSCNNLVFLNCIYGIQGDTWNGFLANQTNCWHNSFTNISIVCPSAVAGARGIYLQNARGAVTGYVANNSCYNRFQHVAIACNVAGCHCLYLRDCDTNSFTDIQTIGGNASTNAVTLDFNGNNPGIWPNSDLIEHIDTAGGISGTQWNIIGTVTAGNSPVIVRDVVTGNGGSYPVAQQGILTDITQGFGSVKIATQNATNGAGTPINIASTPINKPQSGLGNAGYLFRLSYELTTVQLALPNTVTQSVTVTFTWNNGAGGGTRTSTAVNLVTGGFFADNFTFWAAATTNISYNTTVTAAGGAVTTIGQYRLFVALEKLT